MDKDIYFRISVVASIVGVFVFGVIVIRSDLLVANQAGLLKGIPINSFKHNLDTIKAGTVSTVNELRQAIQTTSSSEGSTTSSPAEPSASEEVQISSAPEGVVPTSSESLDQ